MPDDVRLTGPTLRVLRFFVGEPTKARSGAEISRAARVGSGTVYPMLARLEGVNWLSSKWEDGDAKEMGRPRKRLYTLTALGQARAVSALNELQMVKGEPVWAS